MALSSLATKNSFSFKKSILVRVILLPPNLPTVDFVIVLKTVILLFSSLE